MVSIRGWRPKEDNSYFKNRVKFKCRSQTPMDLQWRSLNFNTNAIIGLTTISLSLKPICPLWHHDWFSHDGCFLDTLFLCKPWRWPCVKISVKISVKNQSICDFIWPAILLLQPSLPWSKSLKYFFSLLAGLISSLSHLCPNAIEHVTVKEPVTLITDNHSIIQSIHAYK